RRLAIASHRYAQPIDTKVLTQLMEMPVEVIVYEGSSELYELVARSECDTIIGASLSNDAAAAAGKKCVLLYSGEEAIRDACLRAAEIARELYQTKRSNQITKAVLNNNNFGIIITDTDGRVERINRAAQSFTGISSEQLKGRRLDHFFPALSVKNLTEGDNVKTDTYRLIRGGMMRCVQERIFLGSETTGVLTTIYPEPHNRKKQARQQGEKPTPNISWSDLVTDSPEMRRMIKKGEEIVRFGFPTVVVGERGTGREAIAKCLHNASGRRDAPCLVIDLAAFSGEDAAHILFGFEQNGCSTAGIVAAANNGTIILKNLNLAHPITLACLSRVLDDRQIFRPGMNEPLLPSLNFITLATPEELKDFPKEAAYKLSVMQLEVPPLRERRQDMVKLFLKLLYRYMDTALTLKMTEEMKRLLEYFSWPGNLSQLDMVCRRYSIMLGQAVNPTGKTMYLMLLQAMGADAICLDIYQKHPALPMLDTAAEDFKEGIEDLKNLLKYNDTAIAQKLGISRTTLWRLKNR
ncbi:MAG: PAS domain S-box protein, partial [Clostridia bacterium]|nr:PAS domain S-box protein [Clostridia bacterium]